MGSIIFGFNVTYSIAYYYIEFCNMVFLTGLAGQIEKKILLCNNTLHIFNGNKKIENIS